MSYIVTGHAIISVAGWCIVSVVSGAAVFSPTVKDTTLERIGLSLISLATLAAAFRVFWQGWVSEGYLFLSSAFAFYALAVAYKHWFGPEPAPTPQDKSDPREAK